MLLAHVPSVIRSDSAARFYLNGALPMAVDVRDDDIRIWYPFRCKCGNPSASEELEEDELFTCCSGESGLGRHIFIIAASFTSFHNKISFKAKL